MRAEAHQILIQKGNLALLIHWVRGSRALSLKGVRHMSSRPEPAFHSRGWRLGNTIVSVLARIGIGPIQLLTTRGRKSGQEYTTPVVPVEYLDKTWLVAPYGPVSWVQNARASGQVTLRYGRTTGDYAVREVGAAEAAPVLKRYIAVATKTRSQFDATKDSPVEDFIAESEQHPVFELTLL